MDPFARLPIEIIQTIQSFLNTTNEPAPCVSSIRFLDTKEAARTSILSKAFLHAWSTIPDLNFVDKAFSKLLYPSPCSYTKDYAQEDKARETFANYVHHTLTRYQQHNIPIRSLRLDTHVLCEKIADILEQCILKAKESNVKEVYLNMVRIPSTKLVHTVFALKQLVCLRLFGCHLVKKDVQDYEIINCASLRTLELAQVTIDEAVLQNLIRSCPLIELMVLSDCKGPQKIQVANLPKLKRLIIFTVDNQVVDVKAASLELLFYGHKDHLSSYQLNIDSTQNLKTLGLKDSKITDEDFQNLIRKCPILDEVVLERCYEIEQINVSSHLLSSLRLIYCKGLMEVKIDAPNLNLFEYRGNTVPSSLSFASGGSGKRKSHVTLYLKELEEALSFLNLREFLRMFKRSDNISLFINSREISFDNNITGELIDPSNIPEFEEVYITVDSPSSTYSTLMEGLLWSFSPKILSVSCDSDEDFINYLCEELLQAEDDDHPNDGSSNSSSKPWRNYFKHAKFEDRDSCWALDSWKSWADAMQNLGDHYILELSCA